MTATRTRRRGAVLALALALLAVVVVAWWATGSDERRVDAACDTYLQHREQLRSTLSETTEAVERARDAGSDDTRTFLDDADTVDGWVDQWLAVSPDVIASLDGSDAAGRVERGAAGSFSAVEGGLLELRSLLADADPGQVADWLPEVGARLQGVDDTCLWVARSMRR